jgi:RimJ/RimL family protein N-acetyltransferase
LKEKTMEQQPPTIELAGVRLRPLRLQDADSWHAYLSDPRVTGLTSYPEMSLAAVGSMIESRRKSFAAGLSCKWAIALQSDDTLIGTCGFNEWSRTHGWAELAYELARPYWGHGFAAQAVVACLRWAFTDGGFIRVHAFVMVGNVRSERVLERAHFTREGCLRSYRLCRGRPRDFSVFSILRPEWEDLACAGNERTS